MLMKTPQAMIAVLLLLLASGPACSEEFYLLGGVLRASDSGDTSYTWQAQYRQAISDRFGFSVSYINEGHPPEHRRDGVTAQLWGQVLVLDKRLSLEAGLGPYHYCDTVISSGNPYSVRHGWGAVFSLAGIYYLDRQFSLQARMNLIGTYHSTTTVSALIGIGYGFDAEEKVRPLSPGEDTRNEVSLLVGQATVNSLDSETSFSQYLEYRRYIGRYIDLTFSLLNEGEKEDLLCRYGVATQLWAVKRLPGERLTLGIGLGPYLVLDDCRDDRSERSRMTFAGLLTFTGSYRVSFRWQIRASWSRIITDYDRDTDLFLIGPGFRF